MSSSGDSSPDWLRSYQVPTPDSPLNLSSDSEPLLDSGGFSDENRIDDQESSPKSPKTPNVNKNKSATRKKTDTQKEINVKEEMKTELDSDTDKETKHKEPVHSLWELSSDSGSSRDHIPKTEDHIDQVETSKPQISQPPGEVECGDGLHDKDGKSPSKKASKAKTSQKQIKVEGSTPVKGRKTKVNVNGKGGDGDVEVKEEENVGKPVGLNVSSSMLPLMLSEKVHRTKALIECQGDSIDLSGDMGAVGRIIISDSLSGDPEMSLDLKGTVYKTSIVPCRTFCVVSFGQSEAKIEAIMNDFVQLNPPYDVYEAETMVEGTLDGFNFDSDEEAGKNQKTTNPDQNEHAEEQTPGKSKRNADKTPGAEKKRGRSTGGKSQSKVSKKKAPSSKRAKTKK